MSEKLPLEILLNSPNSFFNICKRILAVFLGAAFLYVMFLVMQDDRFLSVELVFASVSLLLLAGVFFYYGFLRSSIHPKRYFRFTEEGIAGSFPTDSEAPSVTAGALGLLFHALFSDDHDEINVKLNQISDIEIGRSKITVHIHHRSEAVIRLGSISFKQRKLIKERFMYYKEKVERDQET